MPRVDKRFWASTRGRLVTRLRQGPQSVSELAAAFGLTANAIRAHLATLERDRLVRPSGTRRGIRRPAVTYVLSPQAGQLFPKAYGPVLRCLIEAVRETVSGRQLDTIVRAAGHRIAQGVFPRGVPTREKSPARRAVTVLSELGGYCECENANGSVVLECSDCPLGLAANGHPEICQMVETVLADVIGADVQQRCRTAPPRCRFEITNARTSV